MSAKDRISGSLGMKLKAPSMAADDGIIEGYGSVFGVVDSYGEIVNKGAFANSLKSLNKKDRSLPILWQHRSDQPIGTYSSAAEDDHGLKVTGDLLINDIPQAAQAYVLAKKSVVTGLSIGFYVLNSTWDEEEEQLYLNEVDLVECSMVTFPANDAARIQQVRAQRAIDETGLAARTLVSAGQLPDANEFRRHLRSVGFSREQANHIIAKGFDPLVKSPGKSKLKSELGALIQSLELLN